MGILTRLQYARSWCNSCVDPIHEKGTPTTLLEQ